MRCAHLLQESGVLGVFKVLQIAYVGNKLGLVKVLLGGQVIEIAGICEALHELPNRLVLMKRRKRGPMT